MMKKAFIILCFLFILVGCTSEDISKDSVQNDVFDAKVGVYYQAIPKRIIGGVYNPLASYAYSALLYNENIYTTSYHFGSNNKSDIQIDSIVGEKITTVYGNNSVYWSTVSEDLSAYTLESTIYKVKGYDEEFRVCIYFESVAMPYKDTSYSLFIFDRLNDISLYKGNELYKERLHLDESVGYIIA